MEWWSDGRENEPRISRMGTDEEKKREKPRISRIPLRQNRASQRYHASPKGFARHSAGQEATAGQGWLPIVIVIVIVIVIEKMAEERWF